MLFHEFGDKRNPLVILIHGVLTPWQMWQAQIDYLKDKYFVIVPALNAHVEEEPSEYLSAEAEAEEIVSYVSENYGTEVHMLCGLSMGGVVAYRIWDASKLSVKKLVLDGAPLVPMSPFGFVNTASETIMRNQYLSIIRGAKRREQKVLTNFVKYFMPVTYLDSFLKFADTMSEESVCNMVHAACNCNITEVNTGKNTELLFLHGTKANEMVAKKAAKRMKKMYPKTKVICLKGYAHGELAIYRTEKWCEIVGGFLDDLL